jgi:phage-related protein (TIGR01555 family)
MTKKTVSDRPVLLNALKEIQTLKNTLGDLVPQQAYQTVQLSNMETLMMNNRYTPLTVQRILLAYLYQEHGIIQTAVDQPVQDAIRGGLEITSGELDNDDIKELQKYMENHNILDTVAEAETWKRLFGGAGIIINLEVDPAQPFKNEKTKKLEFYACDRWELASGTISAEHFNFYGTDIHTSRVIKLCGRKAPSFIRPQLQGWGMSEVERMVRDLNAYLKNKNLIFELLDESKIDVYKIKGFNTSLITAAGTSKIQKRIELANQLKNYQNAVVMDKEDDYEQKSLAYSGLAEMIKEDRDSQRAENAYDKAVRDERSRVQLRRG